MNFYLSRRICQSQVGHTYSHWRKSSNQNHE